MASQDKDPATNKNIKPANKDAEEQTKKLNETSIIKELEKQKKMNHDLKLKLLIAESFRYREGDIVEIMNLKQNTDLNNQLAKIVGSYISDENRWPIELINQNMQFKIHVKNIRLYDGIVNNIQNTLYGLHNQLIKTLNGIKKDIKDIKNVQPTQMEQKQKDNPADKSSDNHAQMADNKTHDKVDNKPLDIPSDDKVDCKVPKVDTSPPKSVQSQIHIQENKDEPKSVQTNDKDNSNTDNVGNNDMFGKTAATANHRVVSGKRLLDRVCVITGAASGIGQGTAILFAEQGAHLALLDIADLNKTVSKIDKSLHKNILCIKCDISNESNIKSSVQLIKNKWNSKPVDILINNACRFIFHSVLTASDADWNKTLSVNVKGHALMMKHIVPIMKKGINNDTNTGGSIVNICSVSSYIAQPECVTYSACKAALLQITKNSSLDLWNTYKIRVNAVSPGAIYTPASEKEMKAHGWSFAEWQKEKSRHQIIKRSGTCKEVASAALFFASGDSSFCTGASLMVDGGQTTL